MEKGDFLYFEVEAPRDQHTDFLYFEVEAINIIMIRDSSVTFSAQMKFKNRCIFEQ